jgi:eukaryotic-like serine/threonine-protein kinase
MTAQARLLGGRYQVGELLGYGGMAEVHRGRDLRLGRDVAIKMLRTDLARDATFQERFRREAQNAAALNHPAIVAVYDTGEEVSSTGEKLPFIVMEFVNGRTLKEVLAAEQRIQPRRALEIIADICAALEFSHRHGIIHRDIKPGNVMLTQNGQVKVMDFGIARALASGATTMTQTSAVIGTAQYLSPEQARGEAVDARSDVYAAGCVLFELLVGHPPFVGDSPVSVAYQHVREDPRSPSDVNPEVPPDVDAIVLKALAKNPLNRYQSAQDMRADALRAVSGRPVLATPVMTEAETIALGGPVRHGPPTAMTRAIPASTVGAAPDRRTSSWVMAVLAALGVLAVVALGVGWYVYTRANGAQSVATVQMPRILGEKESDARNALTVAGFKTINPGDPVKDNCTKNTVAKQDPDPGTQVKVDKPVSYRMCAGPDQVTVPKGLIGQQLDRVTATLGEQGFGVTTKQQDSERPANEVIGVDPKEGSTVAKGSTVTVIYSKGNLKPVPNVVNLDIDTAQQNLTEAGFSFTTVPGPPGAPGQPIIVKSQNPKAGSLRKPGNTQVTLVVTQPPQPSTPAPSDSGAAGGDGNPPPGGLLD